MKLHPAFKHSNCFIINTNRSHSKNGITEEIDGQMVRGHKQQSSLPLKVTACELDDTKESPVVASNLLSFYSQKKEVGDIYSHICLMNSFLIEQKDHTVASNPLQHFCKAASARLIITKWCSKENMEFISCSKQLIIL